MTTFWLLFWIVYAVFFVLFLLVLRLALKILRIRKNAVDVLYNHISQLTLMRIREDMRNHRPWKWRYEKFLTVSKSSMVFSTKPIKIESFYSDRAFLDSLPDKPPEKRPTMYLLLAYVSGTWAMVGVDPHEECAVNFISTVDSQFGDGTAFVVKLPDKDSETSESSEMVKLLNNLENGELDLDAALVDFNKRHQ